MVVANSKTLPIFLPHSFFSFFFPYIYDCQVGGVTRGVFQSVYSYEELNCSRKMSGRGEISRLSFAAANIEFEDIRLDSEAWTKEKT